MHRRALTLLLARYGAQHPAEHALVARFQAFVAGQADCLLRTCVPGHVTASCWIVSADGSRCLLTRHRKLEKWLQLGGHVDGETHVEQAALREAREESGMPRFELVPAPDGGLLPLDLDVHEIPARGAEPKHLHWDVRFLLRAGPGQDLQVSDESLDLRWVELSELPQLTREESVLRLPRKAVVWLAAQAGG